MRRPHGRSSSLLSAFFRRLGISCLPLPKPWYDVPDLVTIAMLMMASGAACAADPYPNHPITLVAPFTAGGDSDIAARNLAAHVRDALGGTMVVLNKGGANGAIGSQYVHDAAPDGYTLLLARVGSQAVLPALQKGLTYKWDDFTFIGLLELNPMACVVNSKSRYHTLDDLVSDLKGRPGKLNYSTSGPATVLNLASQTLLSAAGLPKAGATEIPYKGGADATTALLAGEVDFSCNNVISLVGPIKGGTLRALVTTSPQRLPDLPDVPTARELHYPQLESVNGWSALYGPPGLPADVKARWAKALVAMKTNQDWLSAVRRVGSVPNVLSADDTRKYVADQVAFYTTLGKKLNLELN
ncbi:MULTISPECIES: tripartite tricarboxylate transporter substrate binding protein [unclassified Achromobacter]|uniref:Bug family tripartite tricarboxylate transporter substrate binding protein n=1 Tax=unclassified Achromobacter TaxID=2626865 RepID=UPI000B51B00B|nr:MULTISPECIES: tripartite tricarboxylate transporter substrate binding protein [unclassified Achromobacter]OWT76981.1 ABC transporter substrate-binding protein [Achromobacter sp. HZ28]OWT77861.1 ABC transporter substrate-binding protein [Achromobacter sp. HZ34]